MFIKYIKHNESKYIKNKIKFMNVLTKNNVEESLFKKIGNEAIETASDLEDPDWNESLNQNIETVIILQHIYTVIDSLWLALPFSVTKFNSNL